MADYIRLLRIKHYIKNFLIFLPLFFSGNLFNAQLLKVTVCGFICFSLVSSTVYIFNDIIDVEHDKKHPTKKHRPVASGRIGVKQALFCGFVCVFAAVFVQLVVGSYLSAYASLLLVLYFVLNILYSLFLKKLPIIDVVTLASCYVIRVFYGGIIGNISVSLWLYLVIIAASLYLGFGKRRNELKVQMESREVFQYYNAAFLDKNMYVCLTLADVFYSLWALDSSNEHMVISIPLFFVIMMFYSLNLEKSTEGDLVEIVLKDVKLALSIALFGLCIFCLVYFV